MRDFFNSKGISYTPVAFEKADEVVAAYDSGRCDTYTTDKSGLAAQRTKMSNPDDHMVLPETISKEPLGPVVRQGDSVWEDIVRWSLNVMIEAEEYGIDSSNADSMKTSDNPAIKRLVGAEGELGSAFGLDNEWSLRIIKQVGNYGESYKRNIADTGILPDAFSFGWYRRIPYFKTPWSAWNSRGSRGTAQYRCVTRGETSKI
jgi:general L-amino acid transport system substrate-binding protein